MIVTSVRSGAEIMPRLVTGPEIQSNSPPQYSLPKNTTGMDLALCVWMSVSISNASSSVPKPPGNTMPPLEYFMNMTLRTKK